MISPRLLRRVVLGSLLTLVAGLVGLQPIAALDAPDYAVSIFAGDGTMGTPTPGTATSSPLGRVSGIAVDSAGNVFLADRIYSVIAKVAPDGSLSIFAGSGSFAPPTPGPATSSGLYNPKDVAVDTAGNLYIADFGNGMIEKVTPSGTLSIFAGTGGIGAAVPGPATSSPLESPRSIAVDSSGNVFVASEWQKQVWKITSAGTLSVLAGTGTSGTPTAGPATASPLSGPTGVAVDTAGNVYIVDNNQVLRVATDGTLSIFAGDGGYADPTPGPALASSFGFANGVDVDSDGNVFVADYNFIERITPDGTLSIVIGNGSYGPPVAGPASGQQFNGARGVTVGPSGTLFAGDEDDHLVVKFSPPPAPPAPANLVLSAAGGRSATLTWDAPVSGPTPTGYQVRCMPASTPASTGPGGKVVYVGSTTTSATIADLTGGETYKCYVRARYSAQYFSWLGDSDEGPLSAASNTLAVARTTPPVPTQVQASTPPLPSGQTTQVRFAQPENRSGADITRYDARCASSNGGTTRTGTGPASPVAVANLSTGRTYTCAVSAVNSVGPSAWSASSAAIVVPAGPPTDVRASTPTAANRRTTVSFTRPDGGPAPTGYRATCRSTDGSSIVSASAGSSPVTVNNLVRGKTYTCTVTAIFPGAVPGPASTPSSSFRVP